MSHHPYTLHQTEAVIPTNPSLRKPMAPKNQKGEECGQVQTMRWERNRIQSRSVPIPNNHSHKSTHTMQTYSQTKQPVQKIVRPCLTGMQTIYNHTPGSHPLLLTTSTPSNLYQQPFSRLYLHNQSTLHTPTPAPPYSIPPSQIPTDKPTKHSHKTSSKHAQPPHSS